MRVPIYFEGNLTMDEISAIFSAAGYHLRAVGDRVVASRVPSYLAKPATSEKVVRMSAKPRMVRS